MPSPLAARTACQGIPDSFGPIVRQTCESPPLHRPSRDSPAAPEISDSRSDGSPSRLLTPAHPSLAPLAFLCRQAPPSTVQGRSSVPASASPPQQRISDLSPPMSPPVPSRFPGTPRIRRIYRETPRPLVPPSPLRRFPTTFSAARSLAIPPEISSEFAAPARHNSKPPHTSSSIPAAPAVSCSVFARPD